MTDRPDPDDKEPAEGSRETVENALDDDDTGDEEASSAQPQQGG
jgi:hypothetical protein